MIKLMHRPDPAPFGSRRAVLLACVALTISAGPLSWWAIGEQSIDGVASPDWDYAYGPYAINPVLERAVGWLAVVVAAAAFGVLLDRTVRRRADPRWWWVTLLGVVIAFAIAGSWREMTAGVIGANIGAGALFMLAPVFCAGILALAVGLARRLDRPLRPYGR